MSQTKSDRAPVPGTRDYLRRLDRRWYAIIAIAGAQLWLGLLWFFYWGYGVTRGLIVLVVLIGLFLLRLLPPGKAATDVERKAMPRWLRAAIVLAVLLDLGMMVVSGAHALRTGRIPMDQGQDTWRAARLIWRGENPYGMGELVDLTTYITRNALREKTGLHAQASREQLEEYSRTLDPRLRRQFLPLPPNMTAAQKREASLPGYKYGPISLVLTALFVPLGIPAIVLWFNGAACFGLFAVMWQILKRVSGEDLLLAGTGIFALLLDRHITRDYIGRTATDVWALLFGSLGVLAWLMKKPASAAVALACSVGGKIFPGVGFAPLLLKFRSPWPLAIYALMIGLLFVPWFVWDSTGSLYNIVEWPLWIGTATSSWQYFAPDFLAKAVRVVLLAGIATLWLRYLFGREARLFWCLAVSYTMLLLAGGLMDNNYVPWVSLWLVAAIIEAFAATGTGIPARSTEQASL